MKKILLFVLLFAALKVAGQTTGYFRFDTVRIMKQNGTCELYIINKTKDSLGLLTNIGGGLTTFKTPKVINDSVIVVGNDTLKIVGNGGRNLSNSSLSATGDFDHNWKGHKLVIDSTNFTAFVVRRTHLGLIKRASLQIDGGSFPLILNHTIRNSDNSGDSVSTNIQITSASAIALSTKRNSGPDASITISPNAGTSPSKIKMVADSVLMSLPSVASADSVVVPIGYNADGTRALGLAPNSGGGGSISTTNTAYVDSLGNDGTGLLDRPDKPFATIDAALDAGVSVPSLHIKLSFGTFASPDPSKMRDQLWIEGSGKPGHNGAIIATGFATFSNTAPTRLVGGTILQGTLQSVDHQFVKITDLGVDCGSDYVAGGGTEGNCIGMGSLTSSPDFTLMQGIEIRNVICLGKNPTSAFHAIVLENCFEPIVFNSTTIFGTHGVVGKNVGGLYSHIDCHDHHGDGINLKSNSYAYGFRMALTNFSISATWTTDCGGVYIHNEDGPALATTYIADGIIDATTFGLKMVGNSNNINISNINVLRVTGDGFNCASDGIVNFRGCGAYASGGDGWNISTTSGQTTLSNCYSHANAGDAFDVGSSSGFVELENIFASSNTGANVRAGSNVHVGEYKFISGSDDFVGTILPRKSAQLDRANAFTQPQTITSSGNSSPPLQSVNTFGGGSAITSTFMSPNIGAGQTSQVRIGKNSDTRNFISTSFFYNSDGGSDNMAYLGYDSGLHVTTNGRVSIGYNMGTLPSSGMALDVNGKVMIKMADSSNTPVNILYQDINGEVKKAAVPTTAGSIVLVNDADYTVAAGVSAVRYLQEITDIRTLTLPDASANTKREIWVKTGAMTVSVGQLTITSVSNIYLEGASGSTSQPVNVPNSTFLFKSDGTSWYKMN